MDLQLEQELNRHTYIKNPVIYKYTECTVVSKYSFLTPVRLHSRIGIPSLFQLDWFTFVLRMWAVCRKLENLGEILKNFRNKITWTYCSVCLLVTGW